MTAVAERVVTKPGVYDMTDVEYHADPVPGGSLSSSGARMLLPPSCPALYHYRKTHPQPPKRTFDFGHAAHQQVLGVGPELVEIDADTYRTKAAQEQRDAAYAEGAVPLLPAEYEQVQGMAAAIREHPVASALFNPKRGRAEQSLFWRDTVSGVQMRARLDFLPDPGPSRMIVADYKTTVSAEPSAIERTIYQHGYHLQADWYLDAVHCLGLAEDPAFVLVFQEKTPPYLVTVVEPNVDALMWGRVLNQKAVDIYRHCKETGRWPGYSDDVVLAQLPPYAEKQYEIARERGDYDIKEKR
jgi:hypothetical protein